MFVKDSGPNARKVRPWRRGYTSRDVVAAVLALGLLSLLVFPYILSRRNDARRLTCEARLRRVGEAIDAYHEQQRTYPGYRGALDASDAAAPQAVGWCFAVLPFLQPLQPDGELPATIYEQYGSLGPDGTRGKRPDDAYLPELICPVDPRAVSKSRQAFGSFIANTGLPDAEASQQGPSDWPGNGVLFDRFENSPYAIVWPDRQFVKDHDGLEQTLLLSENLDAGLWTDDQESRAGFVWLPTLVDGQPTRDEQLLGINVQGGQGDGSYRFARPSSLHRGGAYVLYCSGKLQFLNQQIDYAVFTGLMTSDSTDVRVPGSEKRLPPPFLVE